MGRAKNCKTNQLVNCSSGGWMEWKGMDMIKETREEINAINVRTMKGRGNGAEEAGSGRERGGGSCDDFSVRICRKVIEVSEEANGRATGNDAKMR